MGQKHSFILKTPLSSSFPISPLTGLPPGTYLALIWGRRAQLGLDPLPTLHPSEAWQRYKPFLQAGGAVLARTAVLLGTKTLAAAVATRLGPASIASHQVGRRRHPSWTRIHCVASRQGVNMNFY